MTQFGPGDPFGGNAFGDPFVPTPAGGQPTGPTPPTRPPAGQQPEHNTLATLSLVFAFVFAPAGAILGHLGLGQIARTGQRGRERALTGITLSYFFITVAVVGLVVWAAGGDRGAPPVAAPSTTAAPTTTSAAAKPSALPPPPPAPTVTAAALQGIVIPLPELRTLIGDPGQTPVGSNETIGLPPKDQGGDFGDMSCVASFYDGTPNAYDGTNWRNVYSTASVNNQTGQQVGQSVVRFDDAAAAQDTLRGYQEKWRACGGKSTQWTLPNGMATTISYGAPQDAGGGITTVTDTVAGTRPGLVYVRVIAAKANIVVDNTIVGAGMGDMPIKVTQAILDRIPN
jgi:hypothetical protein